MSTLIGARGAQRSRIALGTVRAAALLAAIGAVSSPPLANAAAALMLIAFAFVPDAGSRLRRALGTALGLGWLALVAALLIALIVGLTRLPAGDVLQALLGWRHLLLLPVALAVFDTPQSRARFALGFIAFATLAALIAFVMQQMGLAYKPGVQAGVLLRNTVTQALTFAVAAFLALLLASTGQVRARALRLVLGLAALGLVAQLVFAQTGRSGQIALLVMAAASFLLLMRGRARLLALLALPLLAAGVFAASSVMQQRFAQALDEMRNAATKTEYSSMGIRVVIWQHSAALIAERPWLGYGMGGFSPAYTARLQAASAAPALPAGDWRATPSTDPHNQYAWLWVEAGLPGLLGLALLLLGALRQRAPQPYRAAGIAFLAAWCVTSLFSSHFQTFNEGHLVMLLLGAMLAEPQGHGLGTGWLTGPR